MNQTTQLVELVEGTSLWQDAWKRLKKNRLALFGAVTLILISIAVVIGPMLSPYSYDQIDLNITNQPPTFSHWFGTDTLGRDIFVRSLVGGRISLMVGLVATAVSFVIGVTYGAVSGYFGGYVDELMMRIVDILYSLPYIFLVIVLLAFFSKDITMLFIALGAVSWLTMARIVRGQVLSLKNQEFVEAARAVGVSTPKIIFRHIVPNTLGPVVVYTTLTIPSAMLSEAFLSFLGLGVQPPLSSWGTMVNDGISSISVFPWQLIFPGVMMAITLFSLNFLGDGLRDALDPQSRKE
ncbi:MAG: ABC transporter permease subunit [Blastocatellia bacterium]|nr:ABC transporter permease subunit [Blastocatellia bacterium]